MKLRTPHEDEIRQFCNEHGLDYGRAKHLLKRNAIYKVRVGPRALVMASDWLEDLDEPGYSARTNWTFWLSNPEVATMLKLKFG